MSPRDRTSKASDPSLCLVAAAESGTEWRARVEIALETTEALTLILTPPATGSLDPAVARPLVEMAQAKKIAALIADDPAAARAIGADGVHLSWRPEIEDAYAAARAALGPEAIVGGDAGTSRHDAMSLGEAGADYVGFGRTSGAEGPDEARDTQREMVVWWSDVFVVPLVAFDAETASDVSDLVRQGADFVAVRLPGTAPAEGDRAWALALVSALHTPADAA